MSSLIWTLCCIAACIKISASTRPTSPTQVVVHPQAMLSGEWKDFTSHVGLPNQPWLPVSFEVEMYQMGNASQNIVTDVDLKRSAELVRHALHSVEVPSSLRSANLLKLHLKDEHTSADDYGAWNLEEEAVSSDWYPGMQEIASPISLSEDEFLLSAHMMQQLTPNYVAIRPGSVGSEGTTHVHVDSRCLLNDERRLAGMLLVWENFHTHLTTLTQCVAECSFLLDAWEGPIAHRLPELIPVLQRRWKSSPSSPPESLESSFLRLSGQMKGSVYVGGSRDGYRHFPVNICHLLNIPCCNDCEKNLVPKFGGIEFRAFPATFGKTLRGVVSLAQRLVQRSCTAPLEEMQPLLMWPGVPRPADAGPLLQFLQLEPSTFQEVYARKDVAVAGREWAQLSRADVENRLHVTKEVFRRAQVPPNAWPADV